MTERAEAPSAQEEMDALLGLANQFSSFASYLSQEKLPIWNFNYAEVEDWLRVMTEMGNRESEVEQQIVMARDNLRQYLKAIHQRFGLGGEYVDRYLDGLARIAYAVGVLEGRRSAMDASREQTALQHASAVARHNRTQVSAAQGARKRGEPVRETARAYIARNPKTTLNACASHVASEMHRDQRAVSRTIAPLFEHRDLAVGGRKITRPKA